MVRLALVIGAIAAVLPGASQAKSVSGTIEVSLMVEPSCSVSATPLTFAGQAGEALEAAADIRVACNGDTPVTVRLDGGLNGQGASRRLAGHGGLVEYAIYADPTRSLRWTAGEARSGSAGADPLTLAAYGRIDPGATLGANGSYSDTVTVTVEF